MEINIDSYFESLNRPELNCINKNKAQVTNDTGENQTNKEKQRNLNSKLLKVLDNTPGLGKPLYPIDWCIGGTGSSHALNTSHYIYQSIKRTGSPLDGILEWFAIKDIFGSLLKHAFNIELGENKIIPRNEEEAERIYNTDNNQ